MRSQVTVAESIWKVQEQSECGEQRHHPRIPEVETGSPPTVAVHGRLRKTLDTFHTDHAVLTDALDFEQSAVGVAPEGPQEVEVADILADAEVGQVEHRRGLRPKALRTGVHSLSDLRPGIQ